MGVKVLQPDLEHSAGGCFPNHSSWKDQTLICSWSLRGEIQPLFFCFSHYCCQAGSELGRITGVSVPLFTARISMVLHHYDVCADLLALRSIITMIKAPFQSDSKESRCCCYTKLRFISNELFCCRDPKVEGLR